MQLAESLQSLCRGEPSAGLGAVAGPKDGQGVKEVDVTSVSL